MREPTMHPVIYIYWESSSCGEDESHYPIKEPPHGVRCGGCGQCAHCPPLDKYKNHRHGWWREEMIVEDDRLAPPENVVEWIITMETYVSGESIRDGTDRMAFSSIQISIFPIRPDWKEDPNDKLNVVARAPTYAEILQKYAEYISVAARRERAKVFG